MCVFDVALTQDQVQEIKGKNDQLSFALEKGEKLKFQGK